tara:strand:- start:46634 stop:47686 length:1053 start_codon:yes stop_codon:yes gene_type:complete
MAVQRQITTNLMKKLETFRVMALGEAMNTPILLIGVPGVAKTQAVIDFAKASLNGSIADDDLFLLETDEGTRSNAIKGNIDLEELTLNQKYRVNSPITSCKVVVINEIDKASASLRNSLLGVMNERILFNGNEKVPCVWTNFIATCNSIPDDEKDSPFWDRFLVTFNVNRLSQSDILKYYDKGGKLFSQNHNISIPEDADIQAITLDPGKLQKVIDVIYSDLSDRSLSFLPDLIKNVMVVWNMSEQRGIVKTVELLVSKEKAAAVSKVLVPKEFRELLDSIDVLGQSVNNDEYNKQYDRIEGLFNSLRGSGKLTEEDMLDVKNAINSQEEKLPFLKAEEEEANKAMEALA